MGKEFTLKMAMDFVQSLDLHAMFDLPEGNREDGPVSWCVRQQIMGGDTAVLAHVWDTAAMDVWEEHADRPTDWECRRILSQLFASSPAMLMALLQARVVLKAHCSTHPSVNVVLEEIEEVIREAIDEAPEIEYY